MISEKRTYQKRWFKWTVGILAVLVLIAAGIRLALKSDWLFDKVKDFAIEQASEQLNGTLQIDSIRGDLARGFIIKKINLKDNRGEQVAEIDSVHIAYSLFNLIREPHTLDEINIYGGNFNIEQLEDSTWNVLNLLKIQELEDEEPAETQWAVEQVILADVDIYVQSEQLLPDGYLHIDNLHADLSTGFRDTGFFGTLSELSFQLREDRLPEPIDVYLAGRGDENRVNLESLVINTGRTILRTSAEYEVPGELQKQLEISPLSWQDIALYAGDIPLRQDLTITIGAEGSFENLGLSLQASAAGLNELNLSILLDITDPATLKNFDFSVAGLDLPLLTGLEDAPKINYVEFTGNGLLSADPEVSDWAGKLHLSGIEYEPYQVDAIESDYQLIGGNFGFEGRFNYNQQNISLVASVENLLGEIPDWHAEISSNNLNLAVWLHDDELESDLNLFVNANGSGFDPENFTSDLLIEVNGSRFGDQPFSQLRFSGKMNDRQLEGILNGRIDRSVMEAEFFATNWMEDPSYRFNISFKEFNLAEITGLEDFPTYLNGSLQGEGLSADPENLYLIATASLDSSFVNNEAIEIFSAGLKIENQFISIDEGLLESPIADASFSLNQHLTDFTNTNNRLNFDATIKDLYNIAPLFGFETLETQGTINGSLARSAAGLLEFNGNAAFENIVVDTLFLAESLAAEIKAFVLEEPEVELAVQVIQPNVYGTGVQDLEFYTFLTLRENETIGELSIHLANGGQSSLSHAGSFSIDSTTTRLNTTTLEFQTQLRKLVLEQPFDATYTDDVLRVDSLTIRTTDNDAYLTLWAPHIDSLKQHIGLDAGMLNVGELQETILHESFFMGFLSGNIEVYNSEELLEVKASGILRDFEYEQGRMDSLQFNAIIADEWLSAELGTWNNGRELMRGNLRVPFIPGDPLTFDEQFFERSIEGSFRVNETDLEYWLSFLPEGGPGETGGKITIDSQLTGLAGSPELSGYISVNDGHFSGIRVDTVGIDISYLHENETLDFNGIIVKDRNPILEFDTKLPFMVDLRRAEVLFPADDDSIEVNIRTSDFDLALFNNYLDQDELRQLSGRVEGNVSLTGIIENLEPRGNLHISGGSVRVVQAGITLSGINSRILFEPDRVELQEFTMSSGPGRFRATGVINIESLVPGTLNFNMTANQFRAINTQEYNALLNLQSTLTGTIEDPVLRGEITFMSGLVNLQNFGERAVEDVVLEDEEETEPFEFFEALAMEMSVNFGRQFLIRNRQYLDMEFALGGRIDLLKEKGEDLQLFGTLEGLRGFARPLGKNFELDEAVVGFYGPVDNPQLNITTRYSPPQAQGVNIFYIINGTLQDPEFRFDSEPILELQDIISYTIFGRPFYELESWEQVVAGNGASPTATDFALDVLLDRVELLATQRLGIDVVQIDNTRSGSNNTTSIKTGWFLSEKVFFAILNEVGSSRPKTLFILEYLLRENLELILTQGDDSREGVDLRWRLDY